MIWIRNFLLVGLITSLAACSIGASRHWSEQTGTVLEEGNNKPIDGAIIVARWEGWISALVDSQSVCYHVEEADSDSTGHYRIPEWTKLPGKVHHYEITYTVYKAGYRYVRSGDGVHYLEPDTGSVEERLEYLDSLVRSVGCFGAGKSERNSYVMLKAVFYEAKKLGAPHDLLQWMRKVAASTWLALDGSTSQIEHDKKVSAFLKDHLL